jgi:hypothetical protein
LRIIATSVLLLAYATASVALARDSNASWLAGPSADAFWSELANSPYAQNGDHGLTIYMLSYSGCGNCIAFLRDFWEPRKQNIRLREIFVPVDQPRFINEAADVALTRNEAFADAYYHQARTAPPITGSSERQTALRIATEFTTRTNALFGRIGHIQNGFPTFVFQVRDHGVNKVWIVSGFGPDFARDLDQWVKQAAQ